MHGVRPALFVMLTAIAASLPAIATKTAVTTLTWYGGDTN